LEHVKVIATKVIAQSQELQTKYKQRDERDMDCEAALTLQIDSLNVLLEFVSVCNHQCLHVLRLYVFIRGSACPP
jgi:hypothetical protein